MANESNKVVFPLIAIVAIVAIVGLVSFAGRSTVPVQTQPSTTALPNGDALSQNGENIAGQAYSQRAPIDCRKVCRWTNTTNSTTSTRSCQWLCW